GLLRLSDEQVVGTRVQAFLSAAGASALEELLANAHHGQSVLELELSAADGTRVPVKISVAELGANSTRTSILCAVVTDLTASAWRSDELRASHERLLREREVHARAEGEWQFALDAAGMGSWDLDLSTGEMRRSLRHDQLFGYETFQRRWDTTREIAHFL